MGRVRWKTRAELAAERAQDNGGSNTPVHPARINGVSVERMKRDFERYVLHGAGSAACVILPDCTKPESGKACRCENYRCNQDKEWTFRVEEPFNRGDVVTIEGESWLIVKRVQAEAVGFKSFSLPCNAVVSIRRNVEALIDDNGKVLRDGGTQTIADGIAAILDKATELETVAAIGTFTLNRPTLRMQLNDATKAVAVGDWFELDGKRFTVTDVGYADTDADRKHGVLTLQCRRDVGGEGEP